MKLKCINRKKKTIKIKMTNRFDLKDNWQFKINSKLSNKNNFKKWRNAAVPGTVHTDLLKNKLIDEPFYDDNELKLFWICENNWNYKTTFDSPKDFDKHLSSYLVFEGLDTVSEIFLNKKLIGKSNNMFLKYEFEISSLLKDKKNELEVRFKSPVSYAKSLEKKYGKFPVALDSKSLYTKSSIFIRLGLGAFISDNGDLATGLFVAKTKSFY